MIKRLLAAVAAFGLMSGAAFAQTYVPMSPPPTVPQSVGIPGSTTTTTTVSPTADHTTKITKGVDANGNKIAKKGTYREGIAGSSTETHTKTMTDPNGGTTTSRMKTTTKQE
jgi:hypothetical protein